MIRPLDVFLKTIDNMAKNSGGSMQQGKKKTRFKDILDLSRRTGGLFYLTIFSLFGAAIMTLLVPIGFRYFIDKSLSGDTSHISHTPFIMLGGMALLLALMTSMRYYCVNIIGEKIFKSLREKLFSKILSFSSYETDKFMTGDLMSRLMVDTQMLRSFAGASLSVAARNILLLIGGLLMMFITNSMLSLIALGLIPIVLIPLLIIGRKLKVKTKNTEYKQGLVNIRAEEVFSSLETVQNFNSESLQSLIFNTKSQDFFEASRSRVTLRTLLTFLVISLVFLGVIAMLYQGTRDIAFGEITAGNLTQFIFYMIFTAGSVSSLSEVGGELQKASVAYERIEEILNIQPKIFTPLNATLPNTPLKGDISFQNIILSYENRGKTALNNLSLLIKSGEKIGILGKSGSGKTSLIRLLLRQRNAEKGTILLDGLDISTLDLQYIRNNISYVAQDVTLFTGDVKHNITLGNLEASRDEIIQAAKNAYLHDFILELPEQYETTIGQKGTQLSGGQKQRLTLARAFLKNAPIVILDEATAALDGVSEQMIVKAIDELSKGKTVISITHRPATLKNMDRIIVLEDGSIIDEGNYIDIMKRHPHFNIGDL